MSLFGALNASDQAPLATLEYRIIGTQLAVTPAVLSVPKGVPGSVLVEIRAGDGSPSSTAASLGQGAYVEATLRGPAFEARRLIGPPNAALSLPPLNLVGDYQLDGIRLIDAATGQTKLEATPSSVPVRVFDEVLVSRVTSRPLSLEEIQERGIAIDEQNFRVVEFEVGFVLDGKTVPVRFPVVAPTFSESTELIPAAELESRLAAAQALNREISATAELPRELATAQLNLEIQGINFQPTEPLDQDLALRIPPIPALLVIPGNIGFLNQFFSVQVFTENAAPTGSGLSVVNVEASLVLPAGPDRLPASDYEHPGDDPLRFARLGPNRLVQPLQPIRRPGPDGQIGTQDDIGRLLPGEGGQGEFLVEGLQEGLHLMDLDLTADLEGLAAGAIRIRGKAAGSVLVRNPRFSMAFTHPRTIRAGEPYEATVTLLNTAAAVANLVSVSLPSAALSGGVLESPESVELGTIAPGQTATATFRIRAQRTGAISFSNLTTGDESVQGRFRLKMGIDERGVALSPDTVAMPDYVNELPAPLLAAANRVIGQALSAATAGQLPAGVLPVNRFIVTRRVLELAEAGQRLRYGDSPSRVLPDLLLDWQGARSHQAGFDQIFRQTDAGQEFRTALAQSIEALNALDPVRFLANAAADLAGRGEPLHWSAASHPALQPGLTSNGATAQMNRSDLSRTAGYPGARGPWMVGTTPAAGAFSWTAASDIAEAELSLLMIAPNGTGSLLRWPVRQVSAGTRFTFDPDASGTDLLADADADGTPDTTLPATFTAVSELAPEVIAVRQDTTVETGRPSRSCFGNAARNYGTVLSILFSKPLTQESANVPSAYQLDNGNTAGSIQIQPGARVALANMRQPLGAIVPRLLTVNGVTDSHGHSLTAVTRPVQTDFIEGTALRGRVIRTDGSPAAGVPVTLAMYDQQDNGIDCSDFTVRVCQVLTDPSGGFSIDMVLAGIPYGVSATDTSGLNAEAIDVIMDSGSGDALSRQKLLQLANSPSIQNTLLGAFAVSALSEAVAKAEGLDRALLRDFVPLGSDRLGTVTPVALRFRGRGTVSGRVLAPDGLTPTSGVAVNLFPDPGSREQGRGMFSDDQGRFAFAGVPLGSFTLQAQSATGQSRSLNDVLDLPGELRQVEIILSSATTLRGHLQGRVLETDQLTPHAGAQVFVGKLQGSRMTHVVASARSDANGAWQVRDIPAATYDVVALSLDAQRTGERRSVTVSAGAPASVNIAFSGLSSVRGRVETADGRPAPDALVAGGATLVRTDANGAFRLTGVPVGERSISAGLERNPAAGREFPRFGGATALVLPGVESQVIIRLNAAGRLVGTVYDAAGNPMPRARVALPQDGGFQWVEADAIGFYQFENLPLADYTVSAPAPPAEKTDTTDLLGQIASGSEDQILAAVGEAFQIFTGAANPLLTGEGQGFNPITWGFTRARLLFDGQTVVADVHFLRMGTVAGQVQNGEGVPIGARVRLTGLGPLPNGSPGTILRGERNSDPALGTFSFDGQAFVGHWGLQAASPFYPVVITASGQTTSIEPNATGLLLQFPPTREVNGRLAGSVLQPDGSPVGAGVNVKISFGSDYVIHTDEDGQFDTQIKLPAGGYTVEADDPTTGLRGLSTCTVIAGITNRVDVRLLGKGSLDVIVLQANGAPAPGAVLNLSQGTFPGDRLQGTSDGTGTARFENLFAGDYAVDASFITGASTIRGRAATRVERGALSSVTVTLAPTATLRGLFARRESLTPVAFAQVAIGQIGFTATDAAGRFELAGVPLGNHRLITQDPVTGIAAVANVNLTYDGQVLDVLLTEQARGEIAGAVLDSYGRAYVPGASVTLSISDGLSPTRSVTTGPDGRFRFPSVPTGPFSVAFSDPVTGLGGSSHGILEEGTTALNLTLTLEARGDIQGVVLQPDGITPASNVRVTLAGRSSDTDAQGRVAFAGLPLASYQAEARALALIENRSAGFAQVTLGAGGATSEFRIVLSGVGRVQGRVFLSDGISPAVGALVDLRLLSGPGSGQGDTTIASDTGAFDFGNLPPGDFRLSAASGVLAGTLNGTLQSAGLVMSVALAVGESGGIIGRLVRADGTTPAAGFDVVLSFPSQTGLPGQAVTRTDASGSFSFDRIPVGAFHLEAIGTTLDAVAYASGQIAANGSVSDLGVLVLDESPPRIVSVLPTPGASGVSLHPIIELLFSEVIDPARLDPAGIQLRSSDGPVPASLERVLDPDTGEFRRVRIQPHAPLRSERTYDIVVFNGEIRDASGSILGRGPADLAGRSLVIPFLSQFTTADGDPPVVVSQFPTHLARQVDLRVVPPLAFNEPIRALGPTVMLVGPAGAVPGQTSLALDGQVLTFTPDALLAPNANYTLHVDGIADLAGNPATHLPIVSSFSTLDTLGPNIAALRVVDAASPIAGSTIEIEAVLTSQESGARVRFTRDFDVLATDSIAPYRAALTLPPNGTVTLRAIAADAFGNEGPLAELTILVQPNAPPDLVLSRILPAEGPLPTGAILTLRLAGSDDAGIASFHLALAGPINAETNLTGAGPFELSFLLPPESSAEIPLQIRATATDRLGLVSAESSLTVPISDGTPPTLAILSPDEGTSLEPNGSIELEFAVSDNSRGVHATTTLSGALAATHDAEFALEPNQRITNRLSLSLAGTPLAGGNLVLRVALRDPAGNESALQLNLHIRDRKPPALTDSTPANQAPRQSLWLNGLALTFDEPLDAATVNDSTVLFHQPPPGAAPGAVTLELGGRLVRLRPATLPLLPGTTYTNLILPTLADAAGNNWILQDGTAPPAAGAQFTFTTAAVLETSPASGTRIVPGQSFTASLRYEDGLGANFFRFTLNDSPLADAPADASGLVSRELRLPPDATEARLRIAAHQGTQPPYSAPETVLQVEARDGDADGDSWTNGYEADRAMNPFVADLDSDDFDRDGLSNASERTRGTDPALPDTDHDTLSDSQEVALGTNPLNPDTDGDGLSDSEDPAPLVTGAGLTFNVPDSITLDELSVSNVLVQVGSDHSPMTALRFLIDSHPPDFASLGPLAFANGTSHGSLSATLNLSPLIDHAGTYTLTLWAASLDGATRTHAITITVNDVPSAAVTRWREAVSGNWNDPSRWTDGVPDASHVAVLDASGSCTVTLDADSQAAALILGGPGSSTTLTLNSGRTLTLHGNSMVRPGSQLQLSNGILNGAGSLTVLSTMTWTGGTLGGSGTLLIQPGATLDISGNATRFLADGRVLSNAGTVRWSDNGVVYVSFGHTATANNLAGALWDFQGDGSLLGYYASTLTFNNAGTLRKSGGTGTSEIGEGSPDRPKRFDNSGVVEALSGTLRLLTAATTSIHTGRFNATGGVIEFYAGTHVVETTGTLDGDATGIRFAGANVTVLGGYEARGIAISRAGSVALDGHHAFDSVSVDSGTLALNGTVDTGTLRVSNGTFAGSGLTRVTSAMTWTGGILGGSGTLLILPGATLDISGNATRFLSDGRVLSNAGTVRWFDNGAIYVSFGHTATVNNLAGALWDFQGDGSLLGYYASTLTFNNAGTLRKSGGTGISEIGEGSADRPKRFDNSGVVEALSGTLAIVTAGSGSVSMHSGSFFIQAGSLLRFDGGEHLFNPGSSFAGSGAVRFDRALQLNLAGPLAFGTLQVTLANVTSLSGSFTVSNNPGGSIIVDRNLALTGSLDVGGALTLSSPSVTLTINDTLTLRSGSLLTNPGVIRVRTLIDEGAFVQGNTPVLIGPTPPGGPPIVRIEIGSAGSTSLLTLGPSRPGTVILTWSSEKDRGFRIEGSRDLRAWLELPATVREITPGHYEGRVPTDTAPFRFFRLRRVE